MLKVALNALSRIHSRPGYLKRLGNPDIFSPCRMTPSNFFRWQKGPEYTTVKGVEFIIPVDTMTGQYAQKVTFDKVPDDGYFKMTFGSDETGEIPFDADAAAIQVEIRKITALANATVTGSYADGFTILFVGFQFEPAMTTVSVTTLLNATDPVVATWSKFQVAWTDLVKKGDRIIDGSKTLTIDEIMEMNDIGAQVMAYRCRAD